MLPCRLHRHLGVCDGYIEILEGWRTQNGWADPRSAICPCGVGVCRNSLLDDPTGRCCFASHAWKVTLFADAVYAAKSARLVDLAKDWASPLDPAPRSLILLTGNHAHATGMETLLALKKLPLYSQFSCPQRTTCTVSCVRYRSTQGRK